MFRLFLNLQICKSLSVQGRLNYNDWHHKEALFETMLRKRLVIWIKQKGRSMLYWIQIVKSRYELPSIIIKAVAARDQDTCLLEESFGKLLPFEVTDMTVEWSYL